MKKLIRNLKICLQTPGLNGLSGIPVLIWGPPGGGKTEVIKQLAKTLNLPMETVLLSVREPSDVAGLPIIKNGDVVLEPPVWAKRLSQLTDGILFLDELSCAAPAVQATALRIIAEGVVGELPLPAGIRRIAAANDATEAAGGWELAPPLANRFIHLRHDGPALDSWADWLISGAGNELKINSVEAISTAHPDWINAFAKMKGVVTSFLRTRPALLGPAVPSDSTNASKAWPSPRSWEMATRVMAEAMRQQEDYSDVLYGSIGEGAAKEFKEYEFYADLPDPRDILFGKAEFQHEAKRLDRSYAVLTSVVAYTIAAPDLLGNAWEFIDTIAAKAPDIAVPAVRSLIEKDMFCVKEAGPALAKMQPILKKAGIEFKPPKNKK